jgi:N-acetylglucosamine-6-phosphate deacetylase
VSFKVNIKMNSNTGKSSWKGRLVENGQCTEVFISDGRIQSVDQIAEDPDLPWVSAGWIDLQVNGCGGHDLNHDTVSVQDVNEVTRHLWSKGVATYLPTIITGSLERMQRAFSKIAEAGSVSSPLATSIGGIHMEGPYFSPEDGPRGAHPLEHVRHPDREEFDLLQAAAKGRIAVVTLAPETVGAIDFISYLADRGVIASIGHTGAPSDLIRSAAEAGASMSTHLGNGSHLVLPRHPNYIWEQLADDRLSAGLIADGHHLPISVLQVMLRAKGANAFVVSDCVALAGLPPGEYGSGIGDAVVLESSGRLSMKHSPGILAGSAATLDLQLNTLLNELSMPMHEAIALVTERPAAAMGWSDNGKLAPGAAGHLTLFHFSKEQPRIKVVETVVAGTSVYKCTDMPHM